eukprot:4289589-Pyramimonas_sp.AAC.1
MTKPISIEVAGVPCIAYTPLGSNRRDLHASEVIHHLWLQERLTLAEQRREDLWIGECVTQYPVEERVKPALGHIQTIVWVHDGPTDRELGVRRTRMMDAGINNQTMKWMGPKPEDVQVDYMTRFSTTKSKLIFKGGIYFNSNVEDCMKVCQKMALKRGFHVTTDELKLMDPDDRVQVVFAPGT